MKDAYGGSARRADPAGLARIAISDDLRRFNAVYKAYDDVYHAYAARMGISDSMLMVLYTMATLGEGCTQRDVCAETFVPKQTVNSCVQKLAREGYLTLAPGRGRDVRLVPTDAGRAVIERAIVPLIATEERVFGSLDPGEREQMLNAYERYEKLLRAGVEALGARAGADSR